MKAANGRSIIGSIKTLVSYSYIVQRLFIRLSGKTTLSFSNSSFFSSTPCQAMLKQSLATDKFLSKLLDRGWALSSPDAKISQIMILNPKNGQLFRDISFRNVGENMVDKNQSFPTFYVIRDDLLHPLLNGNKARKLDAVLPLLEDHGVTDVVTCGGCQSAHTAAVAVSCAERGLKSHLLLRGEEPKTLTGYNLITRLYGNVTYVRRSVYSKRKEMLAMHVESIAGHNGCVVWLTDIIKSSLNHASEHPNLLQGQPVQFNEKLKKVCVMSEGAGDAVALLGIMRLIRYLSQNHIFGKNQVMEIVVDAGTGTTAIGLGLSARYLGLPWKVTAIMLADTIDRYKEKEQNLISEFHRIFSTSSTVGLSVGEAAGTVQWVERRLPRKFGNILKGEVEECQRVAQQTGILVDPIYTLAAWDLATQLCQNREENSKVVMLHTGGTLGIFSLAQRYKSFFEIPLNQV